MKDRITIEGRDGAFGAYMARPKALPAPAAVVLQEIFGVNMDMRETADDLAALGFIAFCPDLFWRQEPGLDLNHWSDAEWKKGLALYAVYDRNKGVCDIVDTAHAAGQLDGASGKVGVMGFCLGGLMTFLTAAREKIDAAVAYHGGGTGKYPHEAAQITGPLVSHHAEDDGYISHAAPTKIKTPLANKQNRELYGYPLVHHTHS